MSAANDKQKRFVSARDASRQLGGRPSHPTLIKMIRAGKIPGAVELTEKVFLVPQEWVDSLRAPPPPPTFLR